VPNILDFFAHEILRSHHRTHTDRISHRPTSGFEPKVSLSPDFAGTTRHIPPGTAKDFSHRPTTARRGARPTRRWGNAGPSLSPVRGPEATRASPPRAIQEQCLTQPVGIIPRAAVKPYASAVPRPTVQANAHSRCVWVISVRSDAESGCITGVISITDHSSFCLSEK